MDRRIDRIRVTIEPYRYPANGPSEVFLQIEVMVNTEKFFYRDIRRTDDIESLFDHIFDMAKKKIKQSIVENFPVTPATPSVYDYGKTLKRD